LDALLESKASVADPIAGYVRINPEGTAYLQWKAGWKLVSPTPKPSATPVDLTLTPDTPTPTIPPTNTLKPSATVTLYPTYTPLPTYTLYPTYTPGAGEASEDDPTPTIDTEPQPTPEPGEDKACLLRNLSGGPYNIRADHVATATIVGQVPTSEYATVVSVYVISDVTNEWFRVTYGNVTGWMLRSDDDLLFGASDTLDICLDTDLTPTEYANNPLPSPAPTLAGPTPTKIPDIPLGCTVINNTTSNLNTRSGPGLNYSIIGKFRPGESGQAIQTASNGEELWVQFSRLSSGGQATYAWVAIFVPAQGALASLAGECGGLASMAALPDGGPFASGKILPGVHISWPTNFDAAALAPLIGIAKCLPLTENICRVLKQLNPAIVTIWRDYRIENPTDYELRVDHAGYAARVYALAQHDYDLIEIMNELGFTDEQYPYLSDFMIDVAAYFGARGECILAPAFFPGWPDIGKRQWGSIVPYMIWANAHPCGKWADDTPKYHGVSWHSAAYHPNPDPSWNWVNWSYVAGNAILGDVQMRADYGFGLRDFMGPKIVSELGISDGYQGSGSVKPTCYDNKLAVQETIRVYTVHHSIFDGFAFWNFGSPGSWSDETACLPGMFQ
jgi:hypothetical protein